PRTMHLSSARPVTKQPRIPNTTAPSHPSDDVDTNDDAINTDDPAPVTRIPSSETAPEKQEKNRQAKASTPPQEEPPAPRSKMRERLLASAKRTKKKKTKNSQRIGHDIWQRDDRAVTFEDNPEPARTFSGRAVA